MIFYFRTIYLLSILSTTEQHSADKLRKEKGKKLRKEKGKKCLLKYTKRLFFFLVIPSYFIIVSIMNCFVPFLLLEIEPQPWFFFFFFPQDKVSLWSPRTCSIDQAGPKFRDLPASVFQVLRLKVYVTTSIKMYFYVNVIKYFFRTYQNKLLGLRQAWLWSHQKWENPSELQCRAGVEGRTRLT